MRMVELDGNEMSSKKETHLYIKTKLDLAGYYGNNLDALWDALSTNNNPLQIKLIHSKQMLDQLGEYGKAVLTLFEDAARENPHIAFHKIEE